MINSMMSSTELSSGSYYSSNGYESYSSCSAFMSFFNSCLSVLLRFTLLIMVFYFGGYGFDSS